MTNKENLIQKIRTLGYSDYEIIVSIEDFFEGNDDFGSIGCNIYPDQPSPADFYRRFKEMKQNENVEDIYVRIADMDDGM